MQILDSNIIIYSSQPRYESLREILKMEGSFASKVSKIEVLGYQELDEESKVYYEVAFELLNLIEIDDPIINMAITLRQDKKMSLGNSIVAATAIIKRFTLYTRNERDFSHITGLKIINPMKNLK